MVYGEADLVATRVLPHCVGRIIEQGFYEIKFEFFLKDKVFLQVLRCKNLYFFPSSLEIYSFISHTYKNSTVLNFNTGFPRNFRLMCSGLKYFKKFKRHHTLSTP
jgi:hypothetical protein